MPLRQKSNEDLNTNGKNILLLKHYKKKKKADKDTETETRGGITSSAFNPIKELPELLIPVRGDTLDKESHYV